MPEKRTVKVRARDVLQCLRDQLREHQRIPYPTRRILELAGIDYDRVRSVPASAIESSQRYALWCMRFDGKELARSVRKDGPSWMQGGWWLNWGPMTNEQLKGLEFTVDLDKITMESP